MSSISSVLVYEYFTGGGCSEDEPPAGLASEALGMLWALLTDFHNWGAVRTITVLDPRFDERIPGLNSKTMPADEVVRVLPGNHEDIYLSLLKRCDAVLVLAPETNGILAKFTALAEKMGVPLLCSCSSAVAKAGDKAICNQLFRHEHLPTPDTCLSETSTAHKAARQIGFPLVIKPIDGVGSEGVCCIEKSSDLLPALAWVRSATSHDRILLQSFVDGVAASVSLLIAGRNCIPLSLNCQLIEGRSQFQYQGSRVPFDHSSKGQALELACSAAKAIPGLCGYVGVDLILSGDHVQLIEINPRLTTSYIGLRQVSGINLAHAIWETCRKGMLPDRVPLTGQVTVRKDNPETWGLRTKSLAE
jgi:predicted ATP-grasp superfamily ATP-dependent carboligase